VFQKRRNKGIKKKKKRMITAIRGANVMINIFGKNRRSYLKPLLSVFVLQSSFRVRTPIFGETISEKKLDT
jgi:hypothetical protein